MTSFAYNASKTLLNANIVIHFPDDIIVFLFVLFWSNVPYKVY